VRLDNNGPLVQLRVYRVRELLDDVGRSESGDRHIAHRLELLAKSLRGEFQASCLELVGNGQISSRSERSKS
jgi:hypothetical protein